MSSLDAKEHQSPGREEDLVLSTPWGYPTMEGPRNDIIRSRDATSDFQGSARNGPEHVFDAWLLVREVVVCTGCVLLELRLMSRDA